LLHIADCSCITGAAAAAAFDRHLENPSSPSARPAHPIRPPLPAALIRQKHIGIARGPASPCSGNCPISRLALIQFPGDELSQLLIEVGIIMLAQLSCRLPVSAPLLPSLGKSRFHSSGSISNSLRVIGRASFRAFRNSRGRNAETGCPGRISGPFSLIKGKLFQIQDEYPALELLQLAHQPVITPLTSCLFWGRPDPEPTPFHPPSAAVFKHPLPCHCHPPALPSSTFPLVITTCQHHAPTICLSRVPAFSGIKCLSAVPDGKIILDPDHLNPGATAPARNAFFNTSMSLY